MGFGANRNIREVENAMRNHYNKVQSAIKTGKMSNVKSANRSGYNNEKGEIRGVYR